VLDTPGYHDALLGTALRREWWRLRKRNDRCGGSHVHEDARRGGEVYAGSGRQRSLRGKATRSRLPWILQSFLAWANLHLWLFG
jgi:hypothetical protein